MRSTVPKRAPKLLILICRNAAFILKNEQEVEHKHKRQTLVPHLKLPSFRVGVGRTLIPHVGLKTLYFTCGRLNVFSGAVRDGLNVK